MALSAAALTLLSLAGQAQLTAPFRDAGILRYPSVTPRVQSDQLPLVFSGSPETPDRSGLLYRDTVKGTVRVVAYHANGLGRRARLLVVARNVGTRSSTLRIPHQGSATTRGPDPVIGQRTLLRYFASRPLPGRPLMPGTQAVLYSSEWLSRGAVASVMIDLHSTERTELSVLMVAEGEAGPRSALPPLPRDHKHPRGTFLGANRTLQVTLPSGTARVVLGGHHDLPLRGTDRLTGDPQTLRGNYGVLYDVQVKGTATRQLAFSARGGAYQGTVNVMDSPRVRQLLLGQGRALKDQTSPTLLGRTQSDTLTLQLVPGNGSNLPVTLIFYSGAVTTLQAPLEGDHAAP